MARNTHNALGYNTAFKMRPKRYCDIHARLRSVWGFYFQKDLESHFAQNKHEIRLFDTCK